MLKNLDSQIDRLDELEDNAAVPAEKAAAKTRNQELKQRRKELRRDFNQARYDQLSDDVKREYEAIVRRSRPSSPERPNFSTGAPLGEASPAAVRAAQTSVETNPHPATPSDTNPRLTDADRGINGASHSAHDAPSARTTLASIESEIDRLAARVEAIPAGGERDAAKQRVQHLKDSRRELTRTFDNARYEALKAEVRAEWNRVKR